MGTEVFDKLGNSIGEYDVALDEGIQEVQFQELIHPYGRVTHVLRRDGDHLVVGFASIKALRRKSNFTPADR